MLHVHLKSTSCDKKTTPNVHRKDCKIQDKAVSGYSLSQKDLNSRNAYRSHCRIHFKKSLQFHKALLYFSQPQVSCVDCRGNMSCLLLREKEKVHHILGTNTSFIHHHYPTCLLSRYFCTKRF